MQSTTRALLIALCVFLVMALGLSAMTGGMMWPGMAGPGGDFASSMMSGRGWIWGLGMGFGGLMMLAFWGAVIVCIVLLVRAAGSGGSASSRSTPLETLKQRYAAGEITREQFEQMRKDLES